MREKEGRMETTHGIAAHARRIREEFRQMGAEGHRLRMPAAWRAPLLFASPHSGRVYTESFKAASPLPLRDLRRNEDALVDRLFESCVELGAPLLEANFPRSYLDANRAADDLPPEWVEPVTPVPGRPGLRGRGADKWVADKRGGAPRRARLGLGVVPLIIDDRLAIYRHPPSREEALARVEALHGPYHAALQELTERSVREFGSCLLIDCHSMPGFAAGIPKSGMPKRGIPKRGTRRADIILGDGHGRTARARTLDMLESAFARRGYRVGRNHPYAGGYATLHYGRPDRGVEAVQVEINRELYLNRLTFRPRPGFETLARDIRDICAELIEELAPRRIEAAE